MTRVRCPMGHLVQIGTFEGVTFANNAGGNMVVTCPTCGQVWDAAPVDGTYTDQGGYLTKVVDYIAGADVEQLRGVQRRMEAAVHNHATAEAVALLTEMGWRPPSTVRSSLETANLAFDLVQKLIVVVTILVASGSWTVDQVSRLLAEWVK